MSSASIDAAEANGPANNITTTTTTTTTNNNNNRASDVYDRQIRLWGAEAQAKISKAKVLYVHLTGVAQEVLKNLTLAGIRPVLCDSRPYPEAILETPSFFLQRKEEEERSWETTVMDDDDNDGSSNKKNNNNKKKVKYSSVAHALKAAVEELNPLLGECQVCEEQDLMDEDFLSQFDLVVASRLGMAEAVRISYAVTKKKNKAKGGGGSFFLVDCFGLSGVAVMDLGPNHEYRAEMGKSVSSELQTLDPHVSLEQIFQVPLGDVTSRVDKRGPPKVWMQYRCILEYQARTKQWPRRRGADAEDFCAVVQSWMDEEAATHMKNHECLTKEALTKLASIATAEVSPICAVLGGIVGNEVIKAISGKGEPANNTLLLDGSEGGKCRNVLVQPKN